jgi:hypothetical protein
MSCDFDEMNRVAVNVAPFPNAPNAIQGRICSLQMQKEFLEALSKHINIPAITSGPWKFSSG